MIMVLLPIFSQLVNTYYILFISWYSCSLSNLVHTYQSSWPNNIPYLLWQPLVVLYLTYLLHWNSITVVFPTARCWCGLLSLWYACRMDIFNCRKKVEPKFMQSHIPCNEGSNWFIEVWKWVMMAVCRKIWELKEIVGLLGSWSRDDIQ